MVTSQTAQGVVRALDGLSQIADRFDLILCDIWGVLHDGVVGLPEASEALARFRAGRGQGRPRRVVLVTNAPRPWRGVQRQLDRLAVPRTAYDAIVTSGDLTRYLIEERRGVVAHHLGPLRDLQTFEGLEVELGSLDRAGYVVCTGLVEDDRETTADYAERLARMRERDLTMVCANPDLVVERGDQMIECAGALAVAYEAIGGMVIYAGKPHRPVYERAFEIAAGLDGGAAFDPSRAIAVGDALRTDIAGARGYGIASLFVARGIHAGEIDDGPVEGRAARVAKWFEGQSVSPDFVVADLVWRQVD